MAILSLTSVLSLFILSDLVRALQVSPNSPCSSVCLDSPSQDVSDPNSSNTLGSDITCIDEHYGNTPKGQKFVSCMNCLHTSTYASDSDETDQRWFLYNMRYTLDSCLFSFANASDSVSSVCSTSQSCGPLQTALENADLAPANESEYSYCTADSNAFTGKYLESCKSCFQNTVDQKYLRNFLVALDAGCNQRSGSAMLLGFQGSVFSATPVNITWPGYHEDSEPSKPKHKKGLHQGATIGIAVGAAALAVGVFAIIWFFLRKRREAARLKGIGSPLDERYGAKNITSPTDGAYGNPYSSSSPPIKTVDPFSQNNLSAKERAFVGQERTQFSQPIPFSPEHNASDRWQDTSSHLSPNPPPSYVSPQLPTHQAYISPSPPLSPGSTTTSIESESYQISPHSSPYASPRNPPPIQSGHTENHRASPYSSPHSTPRDLPPNQVAQSVKSSPRQLVPSQSHIQKSAISPPIPQSQLSPYSQASIYSQASPPLEQRSSSRTGSRAENARRGTRAMGIGNVNASMEVPVKISGPITRHGGRFDFELADRERREREGNEHIVLEKRRKKKVEESPDGEEQWPGSY